MFIFYAVAFDPLAHHTFITETIIFASVDIKLVFLGSQV